MPISLGKSLAFMLLASYDFAGVIVVVVPLLAL
jgi:superfamily II DNA helicase RecQ